MIQSQSKCTPSYLFQQSVNGVLECFDAQAEFFLEMMNFNPLRPGGNKKFTHT